MFNHQEYYNFIIVLPGFSRIRRCCCEDVDIFGQFLVKHATTVAGFHIEHTLSKHFFRIHLLQGVHQIVGIQVWAIRHLHVFPTAMISKIDEHCQLNNF